MANTSSEAYSAILNELNREVTKAKPQDVWQFCANWVSAFIAGRSCTRSHVVTVVQWQIGGAA